MSTAQHLIAACGSLRSAWTWLAETTVPGNSRRTQRQQSDAARRHAHQLGTEERADRHALLTSGRTPSGTTKAPTSIAAIDARTGIADSVNATAWALASHLRTHIRIPYQPGQPAYRPDGRTADTTVRVALDWISVNATHIADQGVINTAYAELLHADDVARTVAGCGPDRRPLAAECPACGRRSLTSDTSSPDYREWAVRCGRAACTCRGDDCRCRIPLRQPGMTHVWLQAGWERFAEQLAQTEG